MSKDVMAECLEEARGIWKQAHISSGDVSKMYVEYYQPIATIAVALYQERCAREREGVTRATMPYEEAGARGYISTTSHAT